MKMKKMLTILTLAAAVGAADHARAYPSDRHPQIFRSRTCPAQWVDIPGSRLWFTGSIKNTGNEGAMGPTFRIGKRTIWFGDDLYSPAIDQLGKACPKLELAG